MCCKDDHKFKPGDRVRPEEGHEWWGVEEDRQGEAGTVVAYGDVPQPCATYSAVIAALDKDTLVFKDEEFLESAPATCPKCGQELPEGCCQ